MRDLRVVGAATAPALLLAALAFAGRAESPRPGEGEGDTTVQGKVVRVDPDQNQLVVRTADGREVRLYSEPDTTYRSRGRTVRLTDLREGMGLSALFYPKDGQKVLLSITLADERGTDEERAARPERRADDRGADARPSRRVQNADRRPEDNRGADEGTADTSGTSVSGRVIRVGSEPDRVIFQTADGREVVLYLDKNREFTARFETRGGRRILRSITAGAASANQTGEERKETTRPVRETTAGTNPPAGNTVVPVAPPPGGTVPVPLPTALPTGPGVPPAVQPAPPGGRPPAPVTPRRPFGRLRDR